MLSDNERAEIVKSQAALDQSWKAMESLLPSICKISDSGILTSQELEIALMCAKVVSWELTLRLIQRDQYLRCIILPVDQKLPEEVAVRITTTTGQQTFYVNKKDVLCDDEDSDTGKIEVRAAIFDTGIFSVQLPTVHKNIIYVPGSEISLS